MIRNMFRQVGAVAVVSFLWQHRGSAIRTFDLACRLARKCGTVSATGVYAERMEVHMGVVWIKALTVKTGHANVIKHVDPVIAALVDGRLDPSPLVTHHMKLDDAAEAYDVYDRKEALKVVLTP